LVGGTRPCIFCFFFRRWLRGWLHSGIWIITFAVNAVVLLRLNRDVVSARLKPKWSTERSDTILLILFLPVTLAVPVVAGLRFPR
jgi:hypothetical protein